MKKFLIIASALLLGSISANAATLTVVVEGINENGGTAVVNVFDKEADWLKVPLVGEKAPAKAPSVELVFKNLPAGDYGVWAHQDVNGDGTLNKGAFGKPTEPYGFSNDSGKMFGPADWEDAKVNLPAEGDVKIVIHVR